MLLNIAKDIDAKESASCRQVLLATELVANGTKCNLK